MSAKTTIAKDLTKYNKVIHSHNTLVIHLTSNPSSINILSSSLTKINTLTGIPSDSVEKVFFSLIAIPSKHSMLTYSSKTSNSNEESIKTVLQYTKYYTVTNVSNANCNALPIQVPCDSFKKIMQLTMHPWLEFINYFTIEISMIETTTVINRKRTIRDIQLERILRYIDLYQLIMTQSQSKQKLCISSFSMKTIIKMMAENRHAVSKYIQVLVITRKEYKALAKKNRRIIHYSKQMQLKEEVEENEISTQHLMQKSIDYGIKMKRSQLNTLEMAICVGHGIIKQIKEKFEEMKMRLKGYAVSDRCYIKVNDANKKEHFVKKIMMVNKKKGETVRNIKGEDIIIGKRRKEKEANEEYVYLLFKKKGKETEIIIMIDLETMNQLIDDWKIIKQEEVIINEYDNKQLNIFMSQLVIPNKEMQDDLEYKQKLLLQVNDPNRLMILISKSILISYHSYINLFNNPSSTEEEYIINDCLYPDNKIHLSKKTMKTFIMKEEYEYVRVKHEDMTTSIVSKQTMINAILSFNENNITLTDYNGKKTMFNLEKIDIDTLTDNIGNLNIGMESKGMMAILSHEEVWRNVLRQGRNDRSVEKIKVNDNIKIRTAVFTRQKIE